MANLPTFGMPSVRSRIVTEIHDPETGELVARLGVEEIEETDAQGNTTVVKRSIRIILADNTVYDPSESMGKDARAILVVCTLCRRPKWWQQPSHGLFNAKKHGKHCSRCGRLTCPRHRRKYHGRWLCLRCMPPLLVRVLRRLRRMARPLFFRREQP